MDRQQAGLLEQWGITGRGDGALNAKARAGELTPTWQQGFEQLPTRDYLRFAREDYSKNSMIYSCIREKATAFATLPPQETKDDGTITPNSLTVRLLEHPNTYQDRDEFQEELETHFDVAGNVFVAKVRQSADPRRRDLFFGYPVQELQAIRPDKVTIKPGARRVDDVFLIRIDGVVRMEIPARDMIHIKRTNPKDDHYGLSPLEVLAREGAVDSDMTDFERAFYQNAGVPAGLLTVKGKPNPEQTEEIKTSFRNAFNGLRRWFDVLILNDQVTDYKQLALKQSDMGSDETRAHVESRICAVLGVPGQLIGARFALNATSAHSYEQNQFQFWTETMVPDSMRFAAAFNRELFEAEFQTRQTLDSTIGYSYVGVRALQEDNSRKLREVVRMINTGAITVHDAFVLAGLPPPADSDFYLRSANQAEVSTGADGARQVFQVTPSGDPIAEPDNPLEGAARLPAPIGG